MIYTWHSTSVTISGLNENVPTETMAGDKRVGLLKRNGQLYAFAATCPHAGAALCEGWMDPQGRIVCPLHKYRFDPANGRNTSGEGYKLKTYPIEVRQDFIYIGLTEV